ncbi:MAG: diaminopimelate decarboxylase [Dehalococcoidia bacterium]|nr:diaminopimelate decarboxylase [Dehalococcoidia bacterium]
MVKKRDLKEFYEKPTIVKHPIGSLNRYSKLASAVPYASIDGVPVEELVQSYGSPLYVVSESVLRRKYAELYRAFSLRYPSIAIGYSYKTNYLSAICSILHQEGALAEVVSGFEYEIAESLGVPGNQIIFNGPLKRPAELTKAISQGARIHIDSYDELALIEEIAQKLGRTVPVAIRMNMTVGPLAWDRFGFNLEDGQAMDAAHRVISSPWLKLVGLHEHLGTFVLDPDLYRQMAEKLASFARSLIEYGVTLEYLDIGGGYASHNTLHDQWLPADYATPTFDQYADAICPTLIKNLPQPLPLLIMEPGRALVDEAVQMLTSVVSVRNMTSGQKGVVIDAGVNLLSNVAWYRYEIRAATLAGSISAGSILEEVNIYGPLCMNIDVLQHKVALPPLRAGDVLIIKNVGAYNFTQSTQFIQPRPAIVLINEGEVELIRVAENMEYIKQLDKVPQRLQYKPKQKAPRAKN